jgi:hypothetical protein
VRCAGLDLRNNLKFTSFGHLTVLQVQVRQLLDEAFRILKQNEVTHLSEEPLSLRPERTLRALAWTGVPYSSLPRNEGVLGSSPGVGSVDLQDVRVLAKIAVGGVRTRCEHQPI